MASGLGMAFNAGFNPVRDFLGGLAAGQSFQNQREDREYLRTQRQRETAEYEFTQGVRRMSQAGAEIASLLTDEQGNYNEDRLADPAVLGRLNQIVEKYPELRNLPLQRAPGTPENVERTPAKAGPVLVPGAQPGTVVARASWTKRDTGEVVSTGPETADGSNQPNAMVVQRRPSEILTPLYAEISRLNPKFADYITAVRQGRVKREGAAELASALFGVGQQPAAAPAAAPASGAQPAPLRTDDRAPAGTPLAGSADRTTTGATVPAGFQRLASTPSQFDTLFAKYEQQYGLPPGVLKRLAVTESALNPAAVNGRDSNGGSFGLLQVNGIHGIPRDRLMDPEQNIAAGARILADSLRRSGGNLEEALYRYKGATGESGRNTVGGQVGFIMAGADQPAAPASAQAPADPVEELGRTFDEARARLAATPAPGARLRKDDPAEYARRKEAHDLARASVEQAQAAYERTLNLGPVTGRESSSRAFAPSPAMQTPAQPAAAPAAPVPAARSGESGSFQPKGETPFFSPNAPADQPAPPQREVNRAAAGLSAAVKSSDAIPSDLGKKVVEYVRATGDLKTAVDLRNALKKDHEFNVEFKDGVLYRYDKKTGATDIMMIDGTKRRKDELQEIQQQFENRNKVIKAITDTIPNKDGEGQRLVIQRATAAFDRLGMDPRAPATQSVLLQAEADINNHINDSGILGFFKDKRQAHADYTPWIIARAATASPTDAPDFDRANEVVFTPLKMVADRVLEATKVKLNEQTLGMAVANATGYGVPVEQATLILTQAAQANPSALSRMTPQEMGRRLAAVYQAGAR